MVPKITIQNDRFSVPVEDGSYWQLVSDDGQELAKISRDTGAIYPAENTVLDVDLSLGKELKILLSKGDKKQYTL